MEKETKEKKGDDGKQHHQGPNISSMKPVTINAYGGGIYALEKAGEKQSNPPASQTQSADGPNEATDAQPKNQPPPSTGDRDTDITGQSYIQ